MNAGAAREALSALGLEFPESGDEAEETMRKSLVLALMAVGGGASYAAAVNTVGAEAQKSDPSTWRWHVSSILDKQRKLARMVSRRSALSIRASFSATSAIRLSGCRTRGDVPHRVRSPR